MRGDFLIKVTPQPGPGAFDFVVPSVSNYVKVELARRSLNDAVECMDVDSSTLALHTGLGKVATKPGVSATSSLP